MSEFEPVPEPDMEADSKPFAFDGIQAEDVPPIVPEFTTPDVKAGRKRRWWESKPKAENTGRKTRERREKPMPVMPRGGLKPQLENFYMGMGLAVMPFDPTCAKLIMENAGPCAEAMDEWAKTNPAIRRALIQLVTVSAAGKVLMAHAPILMGIAMHHVPALRERQEKMVAEFAEMMANGFPRPEGEEDK